MMVADERTNRLVTALVDQLRRLRIATKRKKDCPELEISASEIAYVKFHWERSVLAGERRLYDLARLLAWRVLGTRNLQPVARILAGTRTEERHQLRSRIAIEEVLTWERLARTTDYSLATRIARRYRYRPEDSEEFKTLYARASFLELQPLEAIAEARATRVLTRVKANDQIWNKVCDAIFDVDEVLARDKILNARTKYIKDVFGIKILTAHREESVAVHEALEKAAFSGAELRELRLPLPLAKAEASGVLELVEHKDYLSREGEPKKSTGWEAIKNVYRWCGQLFEVQIQTEANYFLEQFHLSKTSHLTFEMQRRAMRRHLEQHVPHYRDFRQLLKTIFGGETEQAGLPSWLKLVP